MFDDFSFGKPFIVARLPLPGKGFKLYRRNNSKNAMQALLDEYKNDWALAEQQLVLRAECDAFANTDQVLRLANSDKGNLSRCGQ